MLNIIFVCHGNICRSPMAEFIFKNLINQKKLAEQFEVSSYATSNEAIGEEMHPLAKKQLELHQIPFERHLGQRINIAAYKSSDYVICMEEYNIINLKRYLFIRESSKISLLLDYTSDPKDLIDPWYSHDFERTFSELSIGCDAFLTYLIKKHNLI